MHTQFRKPWALAAIAFVLIMTVAVRVAEYRMPLWATQLREEAAVACAALEPPQSESAATDDAADLYRQAWEMMKSRLRQELAGQERRNFDIVPRLVIEEYRSERKGMDLPDVIRLPLPSQQTPDELRVRMREIVEEYRPALQVLYEGAAHARTKYVILPDAGDNQDRDDVSLYYATLRNLPRLLLLASVSAVLEGNEAEAVQALQSFKAYCNMLFAMPWGSYGSLQLFHSNAPDIWRIMAFGIERNTFSRPTLDMLDDILDYRTTITRDDLVARMAGGLQSQSYRTRQYLEDKDARRRRELADRLFPWLGDGMAWYRDRFIMLHGNGELALARNRQEQLLSGSILRLPEEDIEHMRFSRYRYGFLVDDLYGRVEPMDFDYLSDAYWLIPYGADGEERLGIFRVALAAERYRYDKGEFPEDIADMAPEYITRDILWKFRNRGYVFKRRDTGWAISSQWYKTSDVYSIVLSHPLDTIRWKNQYF